MLFFIFANGKGRQRVVQIGGRNKCNNAPLRTLATFHSTSGSGFGSASPAGTISRRSLVVKYHRLMPSASSRSNASLTPYLSLAVTHLSASLRAPSTRSCNKRLSGLKMLPGLLERSRSKSVVEAVVRYATSRVINQQIPASSLGCRERRYLPSKDLI